MKKIDNFVAYRRIARTFTRPVFSQLAKSGNLQPVKDILLGEICPNYLESNIITLADLFNVGWDSLVDNYRNEYIYKNELVNKFIFSRHSPRTASFHSEFNVGRSIVDVAVINGTSTAYEIKTEFDSSRRLKSQTEDYLKVFDNVYVVTHPNHVARYEKELDERVGIMTLSEKRSFAKYREPISNIDNINSRDVFRCLRRDEYLEAMRINFGETPNLPNGLISDHCEKFFSSLSSIEAHKIFIKCLKARTTHKKNVEFVTLLPRSLKALGYSTPTSTQQKKNLLEVLVQPI